MKKGAAFILPCNSTALLFINLVEGHKEGQRHIEWAYCVVLGVEHIWYTTRYAIPETSSPSYAIREEDTSSFAAIAVTKHLQIWRYWWCCGFVSPHGRYASPAIDCRIHQNLGNDCEDEILCHSYWSLYPNGI